MRKLFLSNDTPLLCCTSLTLDTEVDRPQCRIDGRVSSSRSCLDDEDTGIVVYVSDLQYEVTCEIFQLWSNAMQYHLHEEEGLPQFQNGEETKIARFTNTVFTFVSSLGSRVQQVIGIQQHTDHEHEVNDVFLDCIEQHDVASSTMAVSAEFTMMSQVAVHLMHNCDSRFSCADLECRLKTHVKNSLASSNGIFCTIRLSRASLSANGFALVHEFSVTSLSNVKFCLGDCAIEHYGPLESTGDRKADALSILRISPIETSLEASRNLQCSGGNASVGTCALFSYRQGDRVDGGDAIDVIVGTVHLTFDPLCADHFNSFLETSLFFVPPSDVQSRSDQRDETPDRGNMWINLALCFETCASWEVLFEGMIAICPTCYDCSDVALNLEKHERSPSIAEDAFSFPTSHCDLFQMGAGITKRPSVLIFVDALSLHSSEASDEICHCRVTSTHICVAHEGSLNGVEKKGIMRLVQKERCLLSWPKASVSVQYTNSTATSHVSWDDSMKVLQSPSTIHPSLREDEEFWNVFDSHTQSSVTRSVTFVVDLGTIDLYLSEHNLGIVMWLFGFWSKVTLPSPATGPASPADASGNGNPNLNTSPNPNPQP
jgi:hypothetical protein